MISTFHTTGLEIIKREYVALGMKSNFSLFDDRDQLALLKELTEKWLESDKTLVAQLISTISNWKNDLIDPQRAAELARSGATSCSPTATACTTPICGRATCWTSTT